MIPISRSEPVLYLQRAAIICLNPSLRAAAVLSLDSGVSLSPRPTAATRGLEQKPACSPAGTAGWRFASRGGGFGGRFGCPSALQLVQHRAALCACAVRALSSEGRSQRGCFLGITSTSARARALPTRILLHVTWTQLLSPLVCRQPPTPNPVFLSAVALKRSRAAAPADGLCSRLTSSRPITHHHARFHLPVQHLPVGSSNKHEPNARSWSASSLLRLIT